MAKYTLWNDDIKIEDWKECIEEEIMNERYPDYEGDVDTFIDEYSDECYEYICELNCIYLDDERANLSIRTAGEIICIADLGLWNGRRMGYKLIGHNIADCLYSSVRVIVVVNGMLSLKAERVTLNAPKHTTTARIIMFIVR